MACMDHSSHTLGHYFCICACTGRMSVLSKRILRSKEDTGSLSVTDTNSAYSPSCHDRGAQALTLETTRCGMSPTAVAAGPINGQSTLRIQTLSHSHQTVIDWWKFR